MVRTATAALLVLLGAGAGAASVRCTMSERMQMLEGGLNPRRVERLCDGATDPPRSEAGGAGGGGAASRREGPEPPFFEVPFPLPPLVTQICASLLGPCVLPLPAPVGEVCWCSGGFGPVIGTAQ